MRSPLRILLDRRAAKEAAEEADFQAAVARIRRLEDPLDQWLAAVALRAVNMREWERSSIRWTLIDAGLVALNLALAYLPLFGGIQWLGLINMATVGGVVAGQYRSLGVFVQAREEFIAETRYQW